MPPRHDGPGALAESEVGFRLLAENADGLVVCDRKGSVRFANPAAERLLGRDLAGDREEDDDPLLLACLEGGLDRLHVPRPGLPPRAVEVRRTDITWEGEPAWLASLRDVTETLEAEARARQHEKMGLLGRLAGAVAHDFNNALTSVIGHIEMARAELARSGIGGSHPELEARLELAARAVERTAGLTRRLVDLSRRRPPEARDVDLGRIALDMAPVLRHLAGPGVRLEVESPCGIHVRIDPCDLERLLLDLVSNAREALGGGGAVRIRIARHDEDVDPAVGPGGARRFVRLSVEDDGPGMPPSVRERVFDPLFSTKDLGVTAGLGLAASWETVSQAGGRIWVETAPGFGTAVHVLLPLLPCPADEGAVSPSPAGSVRVGGRVLVVDDDPTLLNVLQAGLRAAGLEVWTAADAEEALAIARRASPPIEVLLADVDLPGRDGPELAELLGRDDPALRVIFMSGFGETFLVGGGDAGPEAPFLSKPFRLREVLSLVEAALARTAAGGAAGTAAGSDARRS